MKFAEDAGQLHLDSNGDPVEIATGKSLESTKTLATHSMALGGYSTPWSMRVDP